jgi:hypothetical protein
MCCGINAKCHAADNADAGGGQPATEATGDLQTVGTGAARADDRDRGRVAIAERSQPLDLPRNMEDRGRVAGLQHPRWVVRVVATDRAHRRRLEALARSAGIEAVVGTLDLGAPLSRERRDQALVGQGEQLTELAAVTPRTLDVRREPRDERGAAQALVARRHAAISPSSTSSRRRPSASRTS